MSLVAYDSSDEGSENEEKVSTEHTKNINYFLKLHLYYLINRTSLRMRKKKTAMQNIT